MRLCSPEASSTDKNISQIRFPEEVNMAENEFGCDIQFAKRQLEMMYLAGAITQSVSAIVCNY